jgi:hypothetical protein
MVSETQESGLIKNFVNIHAPRVAVAEAIYIECHQ